MTPKEQLEFLSMIVPVGASAMALLLAGNLWFVRRLVNTIDRVDQVVSNSWPIYQGKVDNMGQQILDLKTEVQRLSAEFKDVSSLKERLAVLEYAYEQLKGQK